MELNDLLKTLLEAMIDDVNEKHEEKKEFKPHLENKMSHHLGVIGEKTNLKDINGEELYVGDIVDVVRKNKHLGLTFIVKDKKDGFQVAGAYLSNFENGYSEDEDLTIAKYKSYTKLTHNEGTHKPAVTAKLVKE